LFSKKGEPPPTHQNRRESHKKKSFGHDPGRRKFHRYKILEHVRRNSKQPAEPKKW